MRNVDRATVEGFGQEWVAFDQSELSDEEARSIFADYFAIFDFANLGEGFDLGCGSGRWAKYVAPKVGRLHCIDPSDAIEVARKNLAGHENVSFHRADADHIPLEDESQSFGYSLGVLHHIPDPERAMRSAVRKLRPGAQFLVYLYYAMETKPAWFRGVWRVSDVARKGISKLPFPIKTRVTSAIAALVYWPLARFGRPNWPLVEIYKGKSFYTMRTDALDRFGTRLEHRFTRDQIRAMMERCGLTQIRFSDNKPYWVAVGIKA
jgi:SAM-dependent methyltransferase